MKLRNRKTGEVFDAIVRERGGGDSYSLIVCDIKAYQRSKSTTDGTHYVLGEYDTLAELNEEWEDYRPIEPLIKDEKAREAVRVWAEANMIDSVMYDKDEDCIYLCGLDKNDLSVRISFDGVDVFEALEYKRSYTIDELCGEEEE